MFAGLFGRVAGLDEPPVVIKNLKLENIHLVNNTIGADLGGLVGWLDSDTISNVTVTGQISSGDSSYYIGGIAGEMIDGDISSSGATTTILLGRSVYAIGGLVVEIIESSEDTICQNIYWDIGATTQKISISYPSGGRTSQQMSNQKTYINWDFSKIWMMGESYPYLKL